MTDHGHHVLRKRVIKDRRSALNIKRKRFEQLTAAELALVRTPLSTIFADPRNIVRLSVADHHRQHNGARPLRLRRDQLPAGIALFAEDYALEAALEHELRLIDSEPTYGPGQVD